MSAGAVPASLVSRAFLALDALAGDPTDLYFGFHLRLRGPCPDRERLYALVGDRSRGLPPLTHRLVGDGEGARWEPDPAFDPAHHVHVLTDRDPTPRPARALPGLPLDGRRPRWGLWLHRGGGTAGDTGAGTDGYTGGDRDAGTGTGGDRDAGGEWALSLLAHHAVLDGLSLLSVLGALFAERSGTRSGTWGDTRGGTGPGPGAYGRVGRDVCAGLLSLLPDLLPGAAAAPVPAAPPPAAASRPSRELSHAAVDLGLLTATARATGATVNQVHLAALAGALRDGRPGPGAPGTALVPVSTRARGADGGGRELRHVNRLWPVRVPLPLALPDPAARLAAIMAGTSRGTLDRRRAALRVLTERAPERLAVRLLRRLTDPRGVLLTASHVRVPELGRVLGSRVTAVTAVPWLPAGTDCFTLLAADGRVARLSALVSAPERDPGRLVRRWAREVEILHDTAGNGARRRGGA